MSLENQVARVSKGTKDTLKTLINKLGGNVTDELIDQYPSIASALDDVEPAGSAQQALRDAKSYTDQKISEIPTPDVSGQIGTHNADANAHADIRSSISNHTSDANIHVTAEEKTAWNAKADATHASQHASGGSDPITLDSIAFLGTNPISSTTDDTTTNWKNLGSGFAWYNVAGKLNGQPSQYGHLISYIQSTDVFQIWNTQAGGPTYFRSGNSTGWNGGWRQVYDTSNKPTPTDIGAAASSHNHSATNITSGTLAVARGGTGQTTLTPSVGTKGVRQIYAGTSDMTAGSSALTTGVVYFVYE